MPTNKPCPGCGDGLQDRYRKANEICESCREKLAYANQIIAAEKEAKGSPIYAYKMPRTGWYHSIKLKAGVYGTVRDNLEKALCKTAEAMSLPLPLDHQSEPIGPPYHGSLFERDFSIDCPDEYVGLTKRQADAIRHLAQMIADACNHAREEGEKNGAHFVTRLAEGKVSLEELNERIAA